MARSARLLFTFFGVLLFTLFTLSAHAQVGAEPAVVTLYGRVDSASAYAVITQIQAANGEKTEAPILLYIDSGGGELFAGAEIIDAIQASHRPVWTVSVSSAASMAAFIWSYGGKRFLLPHAFVMYHDGHGGAEGTPDQMASQLAMVNRIAGDFEKHIAALAHITIAEYRARAAREWRLVGEEAVVAGIATGVVNPSHYPIPNPGQQK